MKLKRIFCHTLACLVALTLITPTTFAPSRVYAAGESDISGHWAEPYINSAVSAGIATGYADGTFKPDKPVTRAEFASMMNKALGNTRTVSIAFSDVSPSQWYYTDISKAVAAAYVSGYNNNSFKPNNPITREEAAVMISRIVPGYSRTGNLSAFGDYGSISDWALSGMQKTNGAEYMGAYNDGNLHPKDKLTRAQTVKIICDIIKKETIVSDPPSVKEAGTNLSGKIYSNGVIIHKDLDENSAAIDNCVVMGDLRIQGGGSNSIVINNSRIANCSVAKNGSAVRVIAKGDTCIVNTDVSYAARLETSNLKSEDSNAGFSAVNASRSSELTLSGSFPKVNLTGADSKVKLDSGDINTLEVGPAAKNSDITVGSGSTIATANVNSAAAFRGTGTIHTMNANANDITYEKEPSKINIGYGVTTKPEETAAALSVTFDPANGATGVALDKTITITFSQEITKYDGKAVTGSDLKSLIAFTKESKSGTDIEFSASVSSSGKVITITPNSSLEKNVKYYVSFDKNTFKNKNGDGNAAQSISFTIGSNTTDGVTFNPVKDATGVGKSVAPTITFNNAIEKYSGGSITAGYLKSSINFRKDSSGGSEVGFSATINSSSKVITITPDSELVAGQKYYLGFDSKIFRTDSDDKAIGGQNVTWTVGSVTTPTITFDPANGGMGINAASNIFITFTEKILNGSGSVPTNVNVSSAVTLRDNTAGSVASYTPMVSNNSDRTVFTINPIYDMIAGHNYTISVASNSFKNAGGNYAASASASFTIITNVDVTALNTAVTNANNAKAGVVTSADGSDVHTSVYWVTPDQMAALNTAISTATNALSTVRTAEEANTAAAALDNVTTVFKQAKKPGTKGSVDTSEIDQAIKGAEIQKAGVVVSNDGTDVDTTLQWVTPEQMQALNDAIKKAESKKATVQNSDEVTAAVLELNWASVKFFGLKKSYGTKGEVDKALLAAAINKANNLKESTELSEDGTDIPANQYWATLTELSGLASDIGTAERILNKTSATKSEVEAATAGISSAADEFEHSVRKSGLKANQ